MRVIAVFFIICGGFSACLPRGDPFKTFNDFKEEASSEAVELCLKENPQVARNDCSLKNCFSSPITLLALQELLLVSDKALKAAGIDYWLDSGTMIGAERFNAHLPWDDDVDLGVFAEDMPADRLNQVKNYLAKDGFEFKAMIENTAIRDISGYAGLYQVAYQKIRFNRLLMSYVPTISPHDLEDLWLEYEGSKSLLPHLDIFLYHEISPDNYTYQAKLFANGQLKGKTFKRSDLKASRTISVLGSNFNPVGNFSVYGKTAYGSDDLVNDFVVSREHSDGCKTFRLKDIRNHKKLLEHMINYLSFVYSSKASQDMGISFDADSVRRRFSL